MKASDEKFLWFRETVSQYLIKNSLRQVDLAIELGMKAPQMSAMLNGRMPIPNKYIVPLCRLVNIPVPQFNEFQEPKAEYSKKEEEAAPENLLMQYINDLRESNNDLRENIKDLRRENTTLINIYKQ